MTFASVRVRALGLFLLGAFVRACFWVATPDRELPNSIAYEGDAPKWLQILADVPGDIQSALPLYPPGMSWLLPVLTDGQSFVFARLSMVLLGALLAPLLYLLLRRSLSERVAAVSGGFVAVSSGLVVLGSGLHSDIPYLFLFLVGLFPYEVMRRSASVVAAVQFGLTQALACYLRVDHLAFVVMALVWLAARTKPRGGVSALIAPATILLVFAPWQFHIAAQIDRANAQGFPGRELKVLPLANSLPWDADALALVNQTPGFSRELAFAFVNNTMNVRGAKRVTIRDLTVLDEAYGYRPEALSTPLLAMYGPLNFCLANYETSTGAFSRAAFDHRPPLVGGVDRYSSMIRICLQPNGPLRFDYPPHLEIINHGYRIGIERLWARPGWAMWLFGQKVLKAWRGTATGIGSYALPLGMSGLREPVDMTVSMTSTASIWRALLLALGVFGVFCARRAPSVSPFLLFVFAKLVAVVLFFGYARMGALCIPSFAVFWAIGLDRLLFTRMPAVWLKRLLWVAVVTIVLMEGVRCMMGDWPKMQRVGPALGPIIGRDERVIVNYE